MAAFGGVYAGDDAHTDTGSRDLQLQQAIYTRTGYAHEVIDVLRQDDLAEYCIRPIIEFGQAQGELRSGDASRLARIYMNMLDGAAKNLLIYVLPFDETSLELMLSLLSNPI